MKYSIKRSIVYNSDISGFFDVCATDEVLTTLKAAYPTAQFVEFQEMDLNFGLCKGYLQIPKTPDNISFLYDLGFLFSDTAQKESVRIISSEWSGKLSESSLPIYI